MQRYLRVKKHAPFFAALALLLSSCTTINTADDFRKAVRAGTPLTTVESFEVARPLQDVTATLRKKAQECLAVNIHSECVNCITASKRTKTFKPTLVAHSDRTELHLQLKRANSMNAGGPADGWYLVVLDAARVAKNRTKVDIYQHSLDDKFIRVAMRGWAQGDNLGCPDLTRR